MGGNNLDSNSHRENEETSDILIQINGGSKGLPPQRDTILSFLHMFFRKAPTNGAAPNGKSWIRHCKTAPMTNKWHCLHDYGRQLLCFGQHFLKILTPLSIIKASHQLPTEFLIHPELTWSMR